MRRFGIIGPIERSKVLACAQWATETLLAWGHEVLCEESMLPFLPGAKRFDSGPVEAYLSLGGDGTLLRCVPYCLRSHAPVLGMNMGQKGFLTGCEEQEREEALQALHDQTLQSEERRLLQVQCENDTWYGLNDCAFLRLNAPRLCQTKLYVDGMLACQSMADGVILASPTGSTGYALSAGGPMVMPSVDCMVFTAICPHALQYRPVIIPLSSVAEIELLDDTEMEIALQIDGRTQRLLHASDRVQVTGAKETVTLLRYTPLSFFETVDQKLVRWNQT